MTSNHILWTTALVMLAGGLLILATGKRRTDGEGLNTVLHGTVPLIAACAYFAMATGQGLVTLPTDGGSTRIFYFARYIDWFFTTPILLISLGMTATRHGRKRPGALAGAVISDVMMIVTAFVFGSSLVAWARWTWFITSCAAFLGVYYAIWKPQMEAAEQQRDDVLGFYKRDATLLSVLWLAYPFVLAVAPDGLGVIGDAASVLAIAVLDVIAKVVFGLMAVSADKQMTERDIREGTVEAGDPAHRRTA